MGRLKWDREKCFKKKKYYKGPEHFGKVVDAYFDRCYNDKEPPTVPGLILYIGLACKEDLDVYFQRAVKPDATKDEKGCADVLNRALLRIEDNRNRQIIKGEGKVQGPIQELKAYHGWRETKETNVNVKGEMELKNAILPPRAKDMNEWTQWANAVKGQKEQIQLTSAEELKTTEKVKVIDVCAQENEDSFALP